ncbi:hypothetical protein B0H16DRAFT_1379990 [Mycena metata]|uniref:BTB domain-containing protein n=1 Tax=Mycena metata TaxID=1033252 RepID=A0AAD7I7P6_9AGAR|nr:hypothetical protein B0H16DRAFT_1379990 [Mycena metata]
MRDSYYLDTVVFKVETALFKVPCWQFERHSGLFTSLPRGGEGSDDENPFMLHGISKADFQTLLKVLYPLTALPQAPNLLDHEWTSVLKLATLWDFMEVRALAIKHLTSYTNSLDCIERILLGRQYNVSSWLRSGYTELARRRGPITSTEASKIGFEVALEISHLREAAVAPAGRPNPFQSVCLGTAFEAEFVCADSTVPQIRALNAEIIAPIDSGPIDPNSHQGALGIPDTGNLQPATNVLDTPPTTNLFSTVVFGTPTPITAANAGVLVPTSTIRDGGFGKFAGAPGTFQMFPRTATPVSFATGVEPSSSNRMVPPATSSVFHFDPTSFFGASYNPPMGIGQQRSSDASGAGPSGINGPTNVASAMFRSTPRVSSSTITSGTSPSSPANNTSPGERGSNPNK